MKNIILIISILFCFESAISFEIERFEIEKMDIPEGLTVDSSFLSDAGQKRTYSDPKSLVSLFIDEVRRSIKGGFKLNTLLEIGGLKTYGFDINKTFSQNGHQFVPYDNNNIAHHTILTLIAEEASKAADPSVVRELIRDLKQQFSDLDMNKENDMGNTPLGLLVRNGDADSISSFLEEGADPTSKKYGIGYLKKNAVGHAIDILSFTINRYQKSSEDNDETESLAQEIVNRKKTVDNLIANNHGVELTEHETQQIDKVYDEYSKLGLEDGNSYEIGSIDDAELIAQEDNTSNCPQNENSRQARHFLSKKWMKDFKMEVSRLSIGASIRNFQVGQCLVHTKVIIKSTYIGGQKYRCLKDLRVKYDGQRVDVAKISKKIGLEDCYTLQTRGVLAKQKAKQSTIYESPRLAVK